jgi:hypothetical protein
VAEGGSKERSVISDAYRTGRPEFKSGACIR